MITFTIDYSGTPSADDIIAARFIIQNENAARTAENLRRAALTPPGTPLPLLPVNNAANIKTGYLSLLSLTLAAAHASYAAQAKSVSGMEQSFTPAQIAQIRTNLVTRVQNGESAAVIVTDTAT